MSTEQDAVDLTSKIKNMTQMRKNANALLRMPFFLIRKTAETHPAVQKDY